MEPEICQVRCPELFSTTWFKAWTLQNIFINATLGNDGIVDDQDFKQFIIPTDDGMQHCPAPNCMKAYPRMDRYYIWLLIPDLTDKIWPGRWIIFERILTIDRIGATVDVLMPIGIWCLSSPHHSTHFLSSAKKPLALGRNWRRTNPRSWCNANAGMSLLTAVLAPIVSILCLNIVP